MDAQALYDLGLCKNEVEAYLKLIELGKSTAAQVAKEAKMHRPNVYDALDKLVQKGLVSYIIQNDTKLFSAGSKEQLLVLLKSREIAVRNLIPQLEVMKLTAKDPSRTTVFEGMAGARVCMSEMIDNTTKLYVLGVPKDFANFMGPAWIHEWHKRRIENKIQFDHIINQDYYIERIRLLRSMPYTTIKFLPEKYNSPISLFIYDQGVILFILSPPISIRIIGKDVRTSLLNYFNMLYQIAFDTVPQEGRGD
ncbi:hypothetical protein HQ545_06360 [Candidatus Woesearchaeota archaeon]|nr:hypothetical protein [Candidatus Woesearchaeota archaeon]